MKTGLRNRALFVLIVCLAILGMAVWGGETTVYGASTVNPGNVASVSLTVTGQPQARLEWTQATGEANGYTIVRDDKPIVRISGKEVLAYTDGSLSPGKSYTYTVKPHYKDSDGKYIYGKSAPAKKLVNGYSYEKAADGSVTLTGYTGRPETLTTPAVIDGGKVKAIGNCCFRGNVWIKKIRVSEGVTSIGEYGFEACSLARNIFLPDTLSSIGDGAFNGCASMRYCDIPDGVRSIGKGAFLYCSKLMTIDLPESLVEMGDYAFAGCGKLEEVNFTGNSMTKIPDRAFCQCFKLESIQIPSGITAIGKRAFSRCETLSQLELTGDKVSIGDYAFERCYALQFPSSIPQMTCGFAAFSLIADGYLYDTETYACFPDQTEFEPGAFYGSSLKAIINYGTRYGQGGSFGKYILEDGVLYTADRKTLVAWFPEKWDEDEYDYVKTEAAKTGVFTVPEGVETIAPFAFFRSRLKKVILSSTVTEIGRYAFIMSNVDESMLVIPSSGSLHVDEHAFDDYKIPGSDYDEIPEDDSDQITGGDSVQIAVGDSEPLKKTIETVSFETESLAGGGIFDENAFSGYLDIHQDFKDWVDKYIEYNKDNMPVTDEAMPYITMYTGTEHYNQMAAVLNGEPYKTQVSISRSGDDFREMYLMIDHGLMAELARGRMPGDLLLYSGIGQERVSAIAGQTEKGLDEITEEQKQLIMERIGGEYVDPAMMSTTADLYIAYIFSEGNGPKTGTKTLVMIYGSKEAMDNLGAICVDSFSLFSGEEEILYSPNAKYRILDLGTVTMTRNTLDAVTGALISSEPGDQRTYIKLELLNGPEGSPTAVTEEEIRREEAEQETKPEKEGTEKEEPVKPQTLPAPTMKDPTVSYSKKTIKFSWSQVSGAAGYQLSYKKTGDSKWKTVSAAKEQAIAYGMKIGGLYRFRAAAVDRTGQVGARSKTVSILYRKVSGLQVTGGKKAITVTWKKAKNVSGYQILISRNKSLKDARIIKVKGAKKRSYKVKNLKKGKRYYISVCPYKSKNGMTYTGVKTGVKTAKVK